MDDTDLSFPARVRLGSDVNLVIADEDLRRMSNLGAHGAMLLRLKLIDS